MRDGDGVTVDKRVDNSNQASLIMGGVNDTKYTTIIIITKRVVIKDHDGDGEDGTAARVTSGA